MGDGITAASEFSDSISSFNFNFYDGRCESGNAIVEMIKKDPRVKKLALTHKASGTDQDGSADVVGRNDIKMST